MASVSNPFAMFICLYIQLSLCILGTALSARPSLWGKKVVFSGRPCVWRLDPQVAVPALEELTVCVLLRRNIGTEWTGFVYKGPGASHIELGLRGKGEYIVAWLFGEDWHLKLELQLYVWHTVCLTWSGHRRRLQLYVNGTGYTDESLNATSPLWLAQNGTLTLGMSHNMESGELKPENGASLVGEIGLFRMWAREWSAEELNRQSCADGDVVSWDYQHWDHSCSPQPDNTLRCAWPFYKIRMRVSIAHHHPKPVTVPIKSLERIIRTWLKSIFSLNISMHDVFVSSESQTCWEGNNTLVMQAQGSRALRNSTFKLCFSSEVYVSVNPETFVEEVQAYIAEQLSPAFSYESYTLEADPQSLSIQPVESLPAVTNPPPTASTGSDVSEIVTTHGLPSCPTHSSTTKDPLDDDITSVKQDKYFRVNGTLRMTGTPQKPKDIIRKWLDEKLEQNKTMAVLNLKIIPVSSRHMEQNNEVMSRVRQRYKCIFHVQAYNAPDIEETEDLIHDALASTYEINDIDLIATTMTIKHIVPDNCSEDLRESFYGTFEWPESFPQETQRMGCIRPESEKAYRLCKLDIDTDTTSWAEPDMRACKPIYTISDLNNINVTVDNVDEVVDMIHDLVNEEIDSTGVGEGDLSASQLKTVLGLLAQVLAVGSVTSTLGTDIVHIVGDILASKTDVATVTNNILNLTEKLGDTMNFPEESANVTVPLLAMSMLNVNPDKFRGLTFGVTSVSPDPEIFVNHSFLSQPFPDTVTTISLPPVLQDFLQPGVGNRARVQFQFYGRQNLFNDPEISKTPENNWTLNSCIVSASINNSHVTNLKGQHVVVTFSHRHPAQEDQKVLCVFWDFQKHGSQGGWNSRGCSINYTSAYQTSCHCNHLTHFGVLLDVSGDPLSDKDEQILTVISYLGCGISSIFLGITLLTYMAFEKLRRDYPSKILINLSTALLGLNMVFLLDSWLASFPSYGLCIVTAAALHYFLLASFTWMGVEAVHMYFALVKVFNVYVPFYMHKFCALGWGLPLVIVILVLIIDKDVYGPTLSQDSVKALERLQSSEQFCWLQNDDAYFYVTVVAYVLLILLCNITVFVVVLVQIRKMKTNNPAGKSRGFLHDLRSVSSLTVLLGLTWSIAFLAQGPAKVRVTLLYMFAILNSLQGFFIFVFHCLMKENVRKQWRIHLCCGQFRLTDYSGWSQSLTQGGRSKQNQLVHSSNSSTRKISNLSTDSAPGHCQNN